MCNARSRCQKPDELKGKPEDCTPEQIKKCHGDEKSLPCCHPRRAGCTRKREAKA